MRPSAAAALLLTITLTTAVPLAPAREVGGIDMPEQASAPAGGPALRLNGAGVRRKLFVAVYAVGLYLPTLTRDPAQVLAMDGPRLVAMRFLHREVPRDKLVAAWNEGFAANQDPATLATLQARIDRFNALIARGIIGEEQRLDWVEQTRHIRTTRRLLDISYELAPQSPLPVPAAVPPIPRRRNPSAERRIRSASRATAVA